MLFIILSIVQFSLYAQENVTISGIITDANSGETLFGVNVYLESNPTIGTTTNEYGFYSISLPKGNHIINVSFITYNSISTHIELNDNIRKNFEMQESEESLDEVVLVAKTQNKVNESAIGVEKLSIASINKIPILLGEKDLIKTLQLLPGVKSAGDGQSGFTVRGGNLDQNLILLDDAPVYNTSHLLGFFSTFNSEAIKDVTLYKGTAPAQYGGRISSVVDIRMKEGNNQKFAVSGGIGLISSKLNIEGPIQKGKSSFLISGRRTYADIFLKLTEEFEDNKLYFYDLNAKFNYKFSEKDQIFVSGYFGRDVLGLDDRFGIDWGNITATVRYNHLFNGKLFSNTSLIYSNYDYDIEIQNNADPFSILSQVQDFNIKQEFQYYPNNNNKWKFGINAIFHTNNPGEIIGDSGIEEQVEKRNGLETAIYASNDWKVNDKLKINYGLRLSNFAVLGGSDYYELDDNMEVIDTISNSDVIDNYINIEPRISLNYKLNNTSSLKFAYTRNTQNLHLIANSVTTSPSDKWVMSSNNIKSEIGDQISLGYVKDFDNNAFEFSVETYYKWMQNQIDYKDGANERDPIIERQLLYGDGRAYGIEFLLKKNKGKFTGWLGYTLSKSEKQIDGINN
ncbi:MAG: TonB-dependent receptor, partial [Bacteroidales bacterium]|nr:TonB-dependent receptor [Bacteroidales bacterium]